MLRKTVTYKQFAQMSTADIVKVIMRRANKEYIYDYMVGVRGPDKLGCDDAKYLFTGFIRGAATCAVDIHNFETILDRFLAHPETTSTSLANSIKFCDGHYLSHVIMALGAIRVSFYNDVCFIAAQLKDIIYRVYSTEGLTPECMHERLAAICTIVFPDKKPKSAQ